MSSLETAKKVIAKKGDQVEPINTDRECRLVAYSKVLGRDMVLSWTGDDPKVVYVDRTPYTTEEITRLKSSDPESVKATHWVKEMFEDELNVT